jgi:fermentation-respiration switch protein FrsA (DUF1100 family)
MMTWFAWGSLAAACLGFAVWGASRMLYYPMRYPAGEWSAQQSLGAKDVSLQASDGTKLHAWWIVAPDAKLATLHLHGNGGNITHRGLSARSIVQAGSSVLLLDYRGYGRSEGSPSEKGLYRDAEAAYDWIAAQGYGPEQIVIHGESLGTAVAAYLATQRKSRGLILEAPFTSARAVAGRVFPLIGPMLIWGYNTKARIKDVHVPVFMIHGDRDEVIAYEFGQELYAAANEPKSFWTIPGATHNDLHILGRGEFPQRLAAFYSGVK